MMISDFNWNGRETTSAPPCVKKNQEVNLIVLAQPDLFLIIRQILTEKGLGGRRCVY